MTTETTTISTDSGNVHRAAVGIRPTARGDEVEGDPLTEEKSRSAVRSTTRHASQPSNRAATVEKQCKGPIRDSPPSRLKL